VLSDIPPRVASLTFTPFPSVATRLLALFADEESSLATIAACISTDVTLSSRLIKRANAADQPHYCDVRDVLQAAVTLGVDRSREISLTTALAAYAHYAFRSRILRPCWDHSLACAVVASEVARLWGLRPIECYTAGLFHDIGRLALLRAYTYEYEQILESADGHADLITMERDRFGSDHMAVGAWLGEQWNLPESIIEVIARHHEPPTGTLDQLTVVKVACRLTDLLGFGVERHGNPPNLNAISEALPRWATVRLVTQLNNIRGAVAREVCVYNEEETPQPERVEKTTEDAHSWGIPADLLAHEVGTRLPFLGAVLTITALVLSAALVIVLR